jgi:hypothetical protein
MGVLRFNGALCQFLPTQRRLGMGFIVAWKDWGRHVATPPDLLYFHRSHASPDETVFRSYSQENIMSTSSSLSLPELEDRIAITRDNIRQLIEQAAAFSGAEDEERNADRIAEQNEELESLIKQRDALLKKK